MRSLATAFFLTIVLLAGTTLEGEAASGQLVVGARVAPHIRWQVRDEPASLEITPADVARGFVEVAAARLRVQTNDPAGVIVVARVSREEFASGALIGLEQPITVGAGGGFLHLPFRGTAVVERELRWRLPLTERTPAGSYPWPVQITLHPLGRQNP